MSDDKEPKEDEVDDDLEDEDAVEDDDDLEDEDADEEDDEFDEEEDEDADEFDEEDDDDEEDEDGDLGDRVLCVDGACIGVVGADGRCKVCGTVNPDYEPPGTAADTSADLEDEGDESDEDEDEDGDEDGDEDEETSGAGLDDPLDFENRVLCSDGACVGVIGSDGRCRECGKPLSDDDD